MKNRIQREKLTVRKMIGIYCRIKHNSTTSLCEDCVKIWNYASEKLDNCIFYLEKPACNDCIVHCYKIHEREHIKEIMRFSGPKMIFRHPYLALMHFADKWKKVNQREILERKKKNKY